MRLTGNTILITGGTSGIGRALAEAFHQRGNRVVIAGRRQHLLDKITAACPGMRGMQLDVADPRAVEEFAAQLREQLPELNVLINNAGISRPEDLAAETIDLAGARSMIDTNIVGVLQVTAALLPILRRQESRRSSRPPRALPSFLAANSRPIAPARRFFIPGCSRSAFSFAELPSRSSSSPRRTCRRSWPDPIRRPTPRRCRWPTILPR